MSTTTENNKSNYTYVNKNGYRYKKTYVRKKVIPTFEENEINEMKKMKGEKMSYKEIAKKYNTTAYYIKKAISN